MCCKGTDCSVVETLPYITHPGTIPVATHNYKNLSEQKMGYHCPLSSTFCTISDFTLCEHYFIGSAGYCNKVET